MAARTVDQTLGPKRARRGEITTTLEDKMAAITFDRAMPKEQIYTTQQNYAARPMYKLLITNITADGDPATITYG